MELLDNISEALEEGNRKQVLSLIKKALDEGIPADDILNNGLLKGMDRIAELYKINQIFVPHVIMVTSAMNAGTNLLRPYLSPEFTEFKGRAVFGTVRGDIHDIGKSLCSIMAKNRGIEIIDLGTDVVAEDFIEAAIKYDCDIIGMSALLTTSMKEMEKVIKAAEAAGIRDKVSIMIGGAPVSQKFADRIGADFFTKDFIDCADTAVEICKAKRCE